MKRLRELKDYRDRDWERAMGGLGDDFGGCFKVKSSFDDTPLSCIASNGGGWDHISVSTLTVRPTGAKWNRSNAYSSMTTKSRCSFTSRPTIISASTLIVSIFGDPMTWKFRCRQRSL